MTSYVRRTITIPKGLDEKINQLCNEYNLDRSFVIRFLIEQTVTNAENHLNKLMVANKTWEVKE